MSTELTQENSFLLNLRVINFFISILAIVLFVWMAFGERVLSPLCEFEIFSDRKESCFRNGAIEMRDRVSIVILLALTFTATISIKFAYIKNKVIEQNFIASSVDKFAFVIFVAAIAARDYYPSFDDRTMNEFSGFGFDVAIVTFFLSLASVNWFTEKVTGNSFSSTQSVKKFGSGKRFSVLAVLGLFYLPTTLLFQSNIVEGDITTHVFNELLAPTAGNFPGADSIPQYNSLLGFPILIVSKLAGSEVAISIIPLWISMMNLGVLATLAAIWLRLFPNTPKPIALLGVSSTILARSSNSIGAYTIASFPSWTVRMAVPVLVALLFHVSISQRTTKTRGYWTLALGATSSLALINNFEFGFACTISVIFAILILVIHKKIPWKFLFILIVAITATIFLINLFYRINGKALKPQLLTIIAREFGFKGFLSWPMPIFGFFLVVYSIAGLAVTLSIHRLGDLVSPPLDKDRENLVADVGLAIFSGVWTFSSLFFYSARSVDGNLRVIFLPALIAFVSTLKLLVPNSSKRKYRIVFKSALLPLATIMVLPVALLINAPDPISNWSRIIQNDNGPKWSWTAIENKPLAKSYIELSKSGIVNIGIMGSDGNAISIVTGAKNILVVNAMADFAMSTQIKKEICTKLALSGVRHVLVEWRFENNEDYPCIGMTNPRIQTNGVITLFEYTPHVLG